MPNKYISIYLITWMCRPPPPIPEMRLSEEAMNEAAIFVHSLSDVALSIFHSIALGKDLNLFYRIAICLSLISIIGSLTDFLTLGYTSKWLTFSFSLIVSIKLIVHP